MPEEKKKTPAWQIAWEDYSGRMRAQGYDFKPEHAFKAGFIWGRFEGEQHPAIIQPTAPDVPQVTGHDSLRIIACMWNDLLEKIQMPGMTEHQKAEMRACFYSGAAAAMAAMETATTLPEPVQLPYVTALHTEIKEFMEGVADTLMITMPTQGAG